MIVTLKNKEISASINSFGAELVSLSKGETNYIWKIDTKYWNKTSPVLFPIVGRLKNDSYTYNEKDYALSRHGFARDHEFKVIHQTETKAIFSFSSNEDTLKTYPFDFELQISYTIIEDKVIISYKVINKNEVEMPFSIGAHPAFTIDKNFTDYTLVFNSKEHFESHVLENDLFSGKTKNILSSKNTIPLFYDLFTEDALVFKQLKSSVITLEYLNKPFLKINFEGFPYLGIWTKEKAPFICIEPWFGLADNHNSSGKIIEKEGIEIIASNSKFDCQFSIELF
ncbi:aldose 1-epimerase family protein [Flavobacterium jejuense]|uniref:Aldose 1-epimerase family protein n=1 Tax=Flavobacterium jejuense TaxID=1544455 RepID=A0ABX0IXD3_9FLAO|nr:aldose 1-epimerase family protein [Flavobacterium jejuense]NHN27826.1 aldose 1-epimerase family protein [Flavobacterium jejuense]